MNGLERRSLVREGLHPRRGGRDPDFQRQSLMRPRELPHRSKAAHPEPLPDRPAGPGRRDVLRGFPRG